MTGVPSTSSGTSPGISLQAVIEAARRLDELSTARVIGEAAEAVHKAQKGGLPLGTLMPNAILVAASGISLAPPTPPSLAYTAPECLRGQAGDRRSDVFSLGIVLWEALTHERLFDAPTDDARKAAVLEREIQAPSELNANVPTELDAICKKALDRDPANRFHSAKVMAAEISAVLDDAGYPDSNDEIASYLAAAFPAGAPVAPTTIGAAIAAKLAAAPASTTPSTRQQLNSTMHGMAPLREPAATKPDAVAAPPEPAKPEPAKLTPLPPIVATAEPVAGPKLDPGKTIPAGSGLSASDLKQAKAETDARANVDAKTAERAKNPSSGLSPTAFMKGPAAAAPSTLTAAPEMPPATPATPHSATTAVSPPSPALLGALGTPDAKPKALIVDEPKPQALIVDDPKPKATISNAETVATPALAAAPSGIVGLPAMPPGAGRSFDDDFSTKPAAKPYVEAAAPPAPVASTGAVTEAVKAAGEPSAAVSPPRPRSATRPGNNKDGRDVLENWGWSTDSHAAIDDGGSYEETPDNGRKRLMIAIGGALGAILLIVVIAMAASGGDDKKTEPKVEVPIADTSRPAGEPVAKAADPTPADPVPTPLPASETTAPTPTTGEPPTPTEPTKVEPAPVEPTKVEPAKAEAAKAEAAKLEAAKVEAAKVEAANLKTAKVEAAKVEAANLKTAKVEAARAEAARAEAAKLEAANLKTAKIEAAKAEAATLKAAKLEAANLKAAQAEAAKAEAAQVKAAKAEAAKLEAARVKAAKVETAKVETAKVETKEPTKKEPTKKDPKKDPKIAAKPIDPYAPEKPAAAPKVDPAIAYKTGFQQYVRGDTGGALTTFKGSLATNPGYPPTWRGLGMVYEKMGQKAQAKKSFTRYLQLSPKAADAEQIRTRMERLGS